MAEWERVALFELIALARRDSRQAERIASALDRYERDSLGDLKKLSGYASRWRLRVGDWRVIFDRDGSAVTVVRLSNRRDAYE